MIASAIDYDAMRINLVAALRAAMQLDQAQVIMAEPEIADAPRPALPYVDIKFDVPARMYGRDWSDVIAAGTDPASPLAVVKSQGPRGIDITFMSFADSHEQAYAMMVTWQMLLSTSRVRESLRTAGLAPWSMANIEDKSALLDTGYEGRAALTVTFGAVALLVTQPSSDIIDDATIGGTATGD